MAARVIGDVPGYAGSPSLRAHADPRCHLRGPHERAPRSAPPPASWTHSSALRRRAGPAPGRARASRDRRRRIRQGRRATPAARAIARSRCWRTRRRRACTRWRSTALELAGAAGRARPLRAAALRGGRPRRARETRRRRRRRSSRRPGMRAPLGTGDASSPARPRATAGGSSGLGPVTTIASCRCSRRRWPRSGPDDAELRARLLARLAGALRDEHARERRDALSREAVELARAAATSPCSPTPSSAARTRSSRPTRSRSASRSAASCARWPSRSGDREQVVAAHMLRNIAHLAGRRRRRGTSRARRRDASRRTSCDSPPSSGSSAARGDAGAGGGQARRGGRASSPRAFELGERALPEVAIPHYRLQRYALCDLRGDLETIEPEIRDLGSRIRPGPSSAACSRISWPARTARGSASGARRAGREATSRRCRSTRNGYTA